MKKNYILAVSTLLVMFCSASNALALLIVNDEYRGGEAAYATTSFDVYGSSDNYDVDRAEASMSGTTLVIDIYSRYFDNIGSGNTELGDLFISTNGWNPVGSAANGYETDYFGQGNEEVWEYALVLDNHGRNQDGTVNGTTSGDLGLYALTTSGTYTATDNILTADEVANGPDFFRYDQEVQYAGTGSTTFGKWEIFFGSTNNPTDIDDFLRFEIDSQYLTDFDINNLGIHWTMTCANDILEGKLNPVPEPMTMVLFSSGLLCLVANSIRKTRQK